MPEFAFNPAHPLILCHATLAGGEIDLSLRMAVDTGATRTMIPVEAAAVIGCDVEHAHRNMEIATASGIERLPIVTVPRFTALGIEASDFDVVCHSLPWQSPVEGLLGLDFLTRARVIIDFTTNTLRTA